VVGTPEASEGLEVKPLTIKVNRKAYSVIRSIIDSSTKSTYPWNKPIRIGSITKFVKYKMLRNGIAEVKAWEITISHIIVQKEGYELGAVSVKVLDGQGNGIAELIIRNQFVPDEEKYRYLLILDDVTLNADSVAEFEHYLVEPDTYIPYYAEIPLADFVNKLIYYLHISQSSRAG